MANEGSYVALGLKAWKSQIGRAGKLFGGLSSEEVQHEIAPGRNRLLYLWGHLTAIHDAMLPLLGLGERLHPEFATVGSLSLLVRLPFFCSLRMAGQRVWVQLGRKANWSYLESLRRKRKR